MTEQQQEQKDSRREWKKLFLNYHWMVRNMGFFLFLSLLAVVYIYNGHLAEKKIKDINRTARELNELKYKRQLPLAATYKGRTIGEYRLDLIVEESVVIEVKSVERFDPVFEAQVLTYLRITGKKVGLLINFNRRLLVEGLKRYML